MDWEYMITIRKNYRTTPNMVRNIATKLFKDITDINTLTYVGERDGLDKSNLYVVKESGQFSCREFRCLNVRFFLLKIVVFVFLVTVV